MPSANNPEPLNVLSVSPMEEDHYSLESIVGHSRWLLHQARTRSAALALLHRHDISVVLCERDLEPGTWVDLMEVTRDLPNSPSFIVTSRLADNRLWAEALNRGAWDVLAKPFDRSEVLRSVKVAWQHWHDRRNAAVHAMGAAS